MLSECGEAEKNLVKYSVLMSVYKNDSPGYVKASIDSMLGQTYPCEQFVIVLDGVVTASIAELICAYQSEYPGLFTVVKLKKNGGLGNALNHGMKACRNELVARMDADDIAHPERCEKQVREFVRYPSLGIVGTQVQEFIGSRDNIVSLRIVPTEMKAIRKFARRRSPFNHMTVMYKKSVVQSFGGYMACHRKEDLELFVKMVSNGVYAKNLSESLVDVRIGVDQLQRRKSRVNCKEYIDIMYKFYRQGYLGLWDMLYVLFGQILMYLLPVKLAEVVSRNLLRKKGGVVRDMDKDKMEISEVIPCHNAAETVSRAKKGDDYGILALSW